MTSFVLSMVFTLSTLSGGDSKCILYSNKDTNVYVPKTYNNANNIRTLYSIYNCVSMLIIDCVDNRIYSIKKNLTGSYASQFELSGSSWHCGLLLYTVYTSRPRCSILAILYNTVTPLYAFKGAVWLGSIFWLPLVAVHSLHQI